MLDSTLITITLIVDNDGTRNIYTSFGEVPAKTMEEAEQVLSDSNVAESEIIDKLVSAIPDFSDPEPGLEASITRTLEQLENEYGFTLEESEEIVGADLDNDNENGPGDDPEHVAIVNKLDTGESEPGEYDKYNPFISRNFPETVSLTDPLAYFLADNASAVNYDPVSAVIQQLDEAVRPETVVQTILSKVVSPDTLSPLTKEDIQKILVSYQATSELKFSVAAQLYKLAGDGQISVGQYSNGVDTMLVIGKPSNKAISALVGSSILQALQQLVK